MSLLTKGPFAVTLLAGNSDPSRNDNGVFSSRVVANFFQFIPKNMGGGRKREKERTKIMKTKLDRLMK